MKYILLSGQNSRCVPSACACVCGCVWAHTTLSKRERNVQDTSWLGIPENSNHCIITKKWKKWKSFSMEHKGAVCSDNESIDQGTFCANGARHGKIAKDNFHIMRPKKIRIHFRWRTSLRQSIRWRWNEATTNKRNTNPSHRVHCTSTTLDTLLHK